MAKYGPTYQGPRLNMIWKSYPDKQNTFVVVGRDYRYKWYLFKTTCSMGNVMPWDSLDFLQQEDLLINLSMRMNISRTFSTSEIAEVPYMNRRNRVFSWIEQYCNLDIEIIFAYAQCRSYSDTLNKVVAPLLCYYTHWLNPYWHNTLGLEP